MPALSFSAKEILQALLNHRKTQTIRPLFCKWCSREKPDGKYHSNLYHQPRLKVGDICKLFWKQRSRFKLFCKHCGSELYPESMSSKQCIECGKKENPFPKILGEVKTTEVFEVKMKKRGGDFLVRGPGYFSIVRDGEKSWEDVHELARRDSGGIWQPFDMCAYFGRHYDLSAWRRFAVYRWRW